jgi:hypothetical protein
MATLRDIACNVAAPNNAQACAYILAMGDKLRLLAFFLAAQTSACGSAPTAPPAQPPPPADTPLLSLVLRNARALYAYNDAIAAAAPAHMPGVDPGIFADIRRHNAALRACATAPPALAALTFWWLAVAHRGVFDMLLATEPADSWLYATPALPLALYDYAAAWITTVSNGDTHHMAYHAVHMQAALMFIVQQRCTELLLRDARPRPARLDKAFKVVARERKKRTVI